MVGPAEASGRVQPGDFVAAVAGTAMAGRTHAEVIASIKLVRAISLAAELAANNHLSLHRWRPPLRACELPLFPSARYPA